MTSADKQFWKHEFGDSLVGYDFADREVRFGSHGQSGSQYGWNRDHILPLSQGGKDNLANQQITNIATNAERANKLSFWIDGILYQVKKVSNLNDDDTFNYPYIDNEKKYCIVEIQEEEEVYYAWDPRDDDDD
jgi:hypothetical protein